MPRGSLNIQEKHSKENNALSLNIIPQILPTENKNSCAWLYMTMLVLLLATASPAAASAEYNISGPTLPHNDISLEGAKISYTLAVPLKNDGQTPKSPVAAVNVWPGGLDIDGLKPVVFSENGIQRGTSILWGRSDEPIRIVFDTSAKVTADEETANDYAHYFLYLWEKDQAPDTVEWERKNGLTLETKNFSEEYAKTFDHSDLNAFIDLWNQRRDFDGRSLIDKVQYEYHLHRGYDPAPKEYLPNMGAPLSLNRYTGYFEVEEADKSKIDDFKEEGKKLEGKREELESELVELNQAVEKAEKELKEAQARGNQGIISNKKTALEEWRYRRDKLEKRDLFDAKQRKEYLEAAISEIQHNTHTFLVGSDGASWLLIDEKPLVNWKHDEKLSERGDLYYGFNEGAINLEPGIYKIDYLYAATGRDYMALLLWRRPAQESATLMENEMFTNVVDAEVKSACMPDGRRPIAWEMAQDSRIEGVPDFVFANFKVPENLNIKDEGDGELSFRWDFGDGGTAAGKKVKHLFLQTGYYDVSLEARQNEGSEKEVLWKIKQPVYVHVPFDLLHYADFRSLEKAIIDKNLNNYPVSHIINALKAVEEIDPDRSAFPDWRRHVISSMSERAEEMAKEAPLWAIKAGDIAQCPTLNLYSEALILYQAAGISLPEHSPEWHMARLREARLFLLTEGKGDEVLEMLKGIEKHRTPVAEKSLIGWWTLSDLEQDTLIMKDSSRNGLPGRISDWSGKEIVNDDLARVVNFKGDTSPIKWAISESLCCPSVTISLRIKPSSRQSGRQYIMSSDELTIYLDNGKPVVKCDRDRFEESSDQKLEPERWYNLIFVREAGRSVRLYVDGKSEIEYFILDSDPYIDTLYVGASQDADYGLHAKVSDVRLYNEALSKDAVISLLIDDDWNSTWTMALMAAGHGDSAVTFAEKWKRKLERALPPKDMKHTAALRRAASLIRRGSDSELLSAMEILQELLKKNPSQLVSASFNIMMIDMYNGRGAHQIAFQQAERVLKLDLNPTLEAEIMARRIEALCGLEDLEKANLAFQELVGKYPYSEGVRQARSALEKLEKDG